MTGVKTLTPAFPRGWTCQANPCRAWHRFSRSDYDTPPTERRCRNCGGVHTFDRMQPKRKPAP